MALYRVVSRIDLMEAVYVPDASAYAHGQKIPSAAHGKMVPVDATGYIEVSDDEVPGLLNAGAIRPLDEEIANLQAEVDAALKLADEKSKEIEKRKADLARAVEAKQRLGITEADSMVVGEKEAVPVAKTRKGK